MLHLLLATSSLQFDKVFTITEDLRRESLQFYPVQLIFQVCSSLLLLLNASLVPQGASKMEAYLRKIKKNSDVLFMLGFHLISDKREPKQMFTNLKIASTFTHHLYQNKSKINMCATILNYRQGGSPSFQTQDVATSLVFYFPKQIG